MAAMGPYGTSNHTRAYLERLFDGRDALEDRLLDLAEVGELAQRDERDDLGCAEAAAEPEALLQQQVLALVLAQLLLALHALGLLVGRDRVVRVAARLDGPDALDLAAAHFGERRLGLVAPRLVLLVLLLQRPRSMVVAAHVCCLSVPVCSCLLLSAGDRRGLRLRSCSSRCRFELASLDRPSMVVKTIGPRGRAVFYLFIDVVSLHEARYLFLTTRARPKSRATAPKNNWSCG